MSSFNTSSSSNNSYTCNLTIQLQTQQPSPTYAQKQQPTQYDEQLSPGRISSKNEIADSANSIARDNDDIFEDLEGDNGADDEAYDDEADDRMIERNRNLLMNSTEIGEGSEAVALPEISINKELLIESVRPYPILWQLSHPGYKDTTRKKIIWQSIKSHQFPGHGVESLKLQWKYLKDAWTRCNTKRSRHLLKSGSKSGKLPRCNFFDQLLFLGDKYTPPSREENFLSTSTLSSSNSTPFQSPPTPAIPTHPGSRQGKENSQKAPYRDSFKRQRRGDAVENEILSSLKSVNAELQRPVVPLVQPTTEKKDEGPNMDFCRSLAPLMDKLPMEQNMIARIKMQQVLYEVQFNKTF